MLKENNKKTKRCPFCHAIIDINAEMCPFCHRTLIEYSDYSGLESQSSQSKEEQNENTINENFKICPFCHSQIPSDSEICPFCHRVLVERFINEPSTENFETDLKEDFSDKNIPETHKVTGRHFSKFRKKIPWILAAIVSVIILSILFIIPHPIRYRLSSLDQRFGISSDEAIATINDAAERWNNVAEKKLFQYDPNGSVTVSFYYDYRQEFVDAEKKIESEYNYLSSMEVSLNAELNRIDGEKYQVSLDRNNLNIELNILNKEIDDLNKDINWWNSLGGSPPGIYEGLESKREELNSKRKKLYSEATQIDQRSTVINKEVDAYNAKLSDYNKRVDERNAKRDKLYAEFKQKQNNSEETTFGEYHEGTHSIIIYSFSDKSELLIILMHEFGHALGYEHAESKNSIMYPRLDESAVDRNNPQPSAEDLELIKHH